MNNSKGFTLIEILVVAAIASFMATTIIINFSRARLDLNETANALVSNIRDAQSKAASSIKYGGTMRCGYGIRWVSATSYAVYVGPVPSQSVDCTLENRNYEAIIDTDISAKNFLDTRVEFKSSFNDIFFEPPDPKTYINNDAALNRIPPSETITIGNKNGSCPSNCKTIIIYTSGKIDVQ